MSYPSTLWKPSALSEERLHIINNVALGLAGSDLIFERHLGQNSQFDALSLLGLRFFEELYNDNLEREEGAPNLADFIQQRQAPLPKGVALPASRVNSVSRAYAGFLLAHLLSRVDRARKGGPSPIGYDAELMRSLWSMASAQPTRAWPAHDIVRRWIQMDDQARCDRDSFAASAASRIEAARIAEQVGPSRKIAGRSSRL